MPANRPAGGTRREAMSPPWMRSGARTTENPACSNAMSSRPTPGNRDSTSSVTQGFQLNHGDGNRGGGLSRHSLASAISCSSCSRAMSSWPFRMCRNHRCTVRCMMRRAVSWQRCGWLSRDSLATSYGARSSVMSGSLFKPACPAGETRKTIGRFRHQGQPALSVRRLQRLTVYLVRIVGKPTTLPGRPAAARVILVSRNPSA